MRCISIWRTSSTPGRRPGVRRRTGFASGSIRPFKTSSTRALFAVSCITRWTNCRPTLMYGWRGTTPNGRTRASTATARRHCTRSSRARRWRTTSNSIGSSRHPNQQPQQRSRRVRQIKSRLGHLNQRSRLALDRAELGPFGFSKQARARKKAQTFGAVERKHPTSTRHHVDDQLSVFPVLELRPAYVERCATDITQQSVIVTDDEIPLRITHRCTAVAASAGLVKHQIAVLLAQGGDQCSCGVSRGDAQDLLGHESLSTNRDDIDTPHRRWGGTGQSSRGSEEAELVLAIAHQHVLGLLIVVEHHLVVLAADTRLLVATERRVRRVLMVAVRPDAPGLDSATHAERSIHVAAPDTGTESVERVVGDG